MIDSSDAYFFQKVVLRIDHYSSHRLMILTSMLKMSEKNIFMKKYLNVFLKEE